MQRLVKMSKVTIAVIYKTEKGVETRLHEETVHPMSARKLNAYVKELYGDNAVVLTTEDVEIMTYMTLETWLQNCTTEPTKD